MVFIFLSCSRGLLGQDPSLPRVALGCGTLSVSCVHRGTLRLLAPGDHAAHCCCLHGQKEGSRPPFLFRGQGALITLGGRCRVTPQPLFSELHKNHAPDGPFPTLFYCFLDYGWAAFSTAPLKAPPGWSLICKLHKPVYLPGSGLRGIVNSSLIALLPHALGVLLSQPLSRFLRRVSKGRGQ